MMRNIEDILLVTSSGSIVIIATLRRVYLPVLLQCVVTLLWHEPLIFQGSCRYPVRRLRSYCSSGRSQLVGASLLSIDERLDAMMHCHIAFSISRPVMKQVSLLLSWAATAVIITSLTVAVVSYW